MENIKVNIGGVNLEMDKEIISKAVEKGELVINDNDLVIYKKDEFDELTKNIANDEYVKGRIDGVEIFGKQVKKEGGFDIENPKVFLNVKGNVDFEKTASEFISKIKPIFETKLNIEPSKKITELQNDLEKIQNNIERTKRHHFAGKDTFKDDMEFHYLMYESTHNPYIILVGQTIMTLFKKSLEVSNKDYPNKVISDHEGIFNALKQKDEKQIREVINKSLDSWYNLSLS